MTEEVSVTWLKPKRSQRLTEWRLNEAMSFNRYIVPKGFITDGGSIPWGLRNSFNPLGKGFPAFISHDHKCKRPDYSRKGADQELYDDLIVCDVNRYRAKAMYSAVRAYAILSRKK